MKPALAIALVFLLTGCATLIGHEAAKLIPDPPAQPVKTIPCTALVAYSMLQQAQLRDELDKDGPVTQQVVEDYAKLRDACK